MITPEKQRIFLPAFISVGLFVLIGAMIQPGTTGGPEKHVVYEQSCMLIAKALSDYAQKHGGNYPTGRSSTEVFQKLLDDGEMANYGVSASTFCASLAGKLPAEEGAMLKPENVAYDVTVGVNASSPAGLPMVYLSGFHLDFRPGGDAVSRVRTYPIRWIPLGFFGQWWWIFGEVYPDTIDWLPVGYKDGSVRIQSGWSGNHRIYTKGGNGIIPGIIAPDFDAHGQTYVQLTPDGPLK